MDFGGVGSGVVLCSENTATNTAASVFSATVASAAVSVAETKHKWCGSGDDWRESKIAKTNNNTTLLRSNISNPISQGQQMLSFSAPNSQAVPLPAYYHQISAAYARNSGYGCGGLNSGNMHGLVSGARGPFTPSQWMELEHQALIYKYLTANVPIPPYLLNPIRKAFESAAFSVYSGLRPNALGWGAFHMGFSNSTDPEPGRCRRTDGKKWRCSRDAVADQKYCERHMNRGRHRSRKPVEGQTGHSASGTTTTTTTTTAAATAKLMPTLTSSASATAVVVPGGNVSNSVCFSSHNNSPSHLYRSFLDKENVGETYQDASSRSGVGLVCSNPLLNPLSKGGNYGSIRTSGDGNDHESKTQHSLHQFIDDWSKNDLQSDQTRLSISIPMSTSDFMSSTSSPVSEKFAASPLKLSWEHETTQMGLGVGVAINDRNQRQGNWIPIDWESSVGGPLGEVFHSTNSRQSDFKTYSALNLMEGWESSPKLASSPTGVLQKAAFCSLSNSSAGSSPRAENQSLHAL